MSKFIIISAIIASISSCLFDSIDTSIGNGKNQIINKDIKDKKTHQQTNKTIDLIKKYQLFTPEIRNNLNVNNLNTELAKIKSLGPLEFDLSQEDQNKQEFVAELIHLLPNMNTLDLKNISNVYLYDAEEYWVHSTKGDKRLKLTMNKNASEYFYSHVLRKQYNIKMIRKIIELFNTNNPKFLAQKTNLNAVNFTHELAQIKQIGPITLTNTNDRDAEDPVAYAIQFMHNLQSISISQIKSNELIKEIFFAHLFNRSTINEIIIHSADLRGKLPEFAYSVSIKKLDIWNPYNSYTNKHEITLKQENIDNINELAADLVEFKIGPNTAEFNNPHNLSLLKKLKMNKNLSEQQIIKKHFEK